jgi:hypothetical protein
MILAVGLGAAEPALAGSMQVATSALTASATGDCGCFSIGPYVDPAIGVPSSVTPISSTTGQSPHGKYTLSTSPALSGADVTVTRVSDHTVMLTAQGVLEWGFSPDDDRFVTSYLSGPSTDNIALYNFAHTNPGTAVWTSAVAVSSDRILFSPSGRYLFYAYSFGGTSTLDLVDAQTGGHLYTDTFTPFIAGVTGDEGLASWGFGPDDSRFVYSYTTDQFSVDWKLVNLTRPPGSLRVRTLSIGSASSFWQFSPCGDVIALVQHPALLSPPVNVDVYNTKDGTSAAITTSIVSPVGDITLQTTAAWQVATNNGVDYRLAPNTAVASCGGGTDADLAMTAAPANITVPATSPAGAVVTYPAPTAVDEAGDTPPATVSCAPASGLTFPIGTTPVTCTATDPDDGNSPVTASFTVTVTPLPPQDADLALTNIPATILMGTTSLSGLAVTYALPSASDEETPPAVSCDHVSGSTFPIGTTTVTCTAADPDDVNSPVTASFNVVITIAYPFASDHKYATLINTPKTLAAPGLLKNASLGTTVTSTTTPGNGTVSFAADGSFTYTPNSDFIGNDTFIYTVTAGDFFATATVHIEVFLPTLLGEFLHSPFDSLSVNGACSLTGPSTFTFSANGNATGPYVGKFHETGTFTVDPPNLTSFDAVITFDQGDPSDGSDITVHKTLTPGVSATYVTCTSVAFPFDNRNVAFVVLTGYNVTSPFAQTGFAPMTLDFLYPGQFDEGNFTLVAPGNTPSNTRNRLPVTVSLPPFSITFTHVTQAGDTTLTSSTTGPSAPTGYLIAAGATYYTVGTTAMFDSAVVCITDPSVTATSVLLQYNNPPPPIVAMDVTDYNNYPYPNVGTTICSIPLSSLSTFVIAEPVAIAAIDHAYSTPLNTPLTVAAPGLLIGDSGAGITVWDNSIPSNGTLTVLGDGSFTYTPNTGFIGTDTFTYTITDVSGLGLATANVTITVGATVPDNDLALTGVPVNFSSNATSPAGAVLTFTPPSASDEEAPPAVSCDHASGSMFPIGATTVTCTATDADDVNSPVKASFTVTVNPPEAAVLPAVSNGAYGGYVTAATIQNTGSAPATVRIAYFDQNGAPVGAGDSISSLPVNASWTVRQDNGNSLPSSGGNAAQAGSAIVYSNQPVAVFVNEFAPGNVGDATSYSGVQVASGVGTTLYAPTIVNNAYGGYTTGIGLLNQGSSPTDVTITYRGGDGSVVKTQTVTALAAHAYRALYSGDTVLALPSGFAGTATISSSAGQPLGAVVNETGPGGQFSSYDAVPSGSTILYAPVALRNAYGGYNTGIGIVNTTGTGGTVTISYYDSSGTPTTTTAPIPANGSLGVYQGTDIPSDGAYTAKITSSVAIAAIVNEVAPSSTSAKQSTAYNTFASGSATLHLPLVESAGSDGWSTGEGIMNTGTTTTTVTVNYYDTSTGAAVGATQTLSLAPNAVWGLYQPSGGLPSGARATAVITTSSGGQVAAICNESSSSTFMSYDGQ